MYGKSAGYKISVIGLCFLMGKKPRTFSLYSLCLHNHFSSKTRDVLIIYSRAQSSLEMKTEKLSF